MKRNSAAWVAFVAFEIMLCPSCRQKPLEIEWQQNLGGSLGERVSCIRQTIDSGYVAVGYASSFDGDVIGNHGATDFWILILNKQGEVLRKECFGGDYFDEARFCSLTSDGGFIVMGHTYSFNGDVQGNHGRSDIWVLKFDKTGRIEWKKTLGGSEHEFPTRILQNKDGTFLISGTTDSKDGDVSINFGKDDAWLVKLDESGNLIWQKTIGGIMREGAIIAVTREGGYILIETISPVKGDSTGNPDYRVLKLDHEGNQEWQKSYRESKSKTPSAIIQTRDGGFVIAGSSFSEKEKVMQNDGWIMKLDAEANLQWEKFYGGRLTDNLGSILQTSDGGYFACGSSTSVDGDGKGNHGLSDFWLIRLNEKGKVQWTKSLGGSDDEAFSWLEPTADGGYIVCGSSASHDDDVKENHGDEDVWIVKLKAE